MRMRNGSILVAVKIVAAVLLGACGLLPTRVQPPRDAERIGLASSAVGGAQPDKASPGRPATEFRRLACLVVLPQVTRAKGSLWPHIEAAGLERTAVVNPVQVRYIGGPSGATREQRFAEYRWWSDGEHSPIITTQDGEIRANPRFRAWFLDCEAIPYEVCQAALDRIRSDWPNIELHAYTAVVHGYMVTNGHDPEMAMARHIAFEDLLQPSARRWIADLDAWCPDAYVWDPGSPIGSAEAWHNTYHYVYRVGIWHRHAALAADPVNPTPVYLTLKLYRGVAPDHVLWSASELVRQEQAARDAQIGGVVYWDFIDTEARWEEAARQLDLLRRAVPPVIGEPTPAPIPEPQGGDGAPQSRGGAACRWFLRAALHRRAAA